jgi:hypothetical protein
MDKNKFTTEQNEQVAFEELKKLPRKKVMEIAADPNEQIWRITAAMRILKSAKIGDTEYGKRRNQHLVKTIDLSPFEHLCRQDMANILKVAPSAIRGYVERGAPQNTDGTYNLSEFVNHIITKRKRGAEGEYADIDKKIKEEQLRKLTIANEQESKNVIPIKQMDEILAARALSMITFFRRSLLENVHSMAMKKPEELHPFLDEVVIQAVDVYRGKKKDED